MSVEKRSNRGDGDTARSLQTFTAAIATMAQTAKARNLKAADIHSPPRSEGLQRGDFGLRRDRRKKSG